MNQRIIMNIINEWLTPMLIICFLIAIPLFQLKSIANELEFKTRPLGFDTIIEITDYRLRNAEIISTIGGILLIIHYLKNAIVEEYMRKLNGDDNDD